MHNWKQKPLQTDFWYDLWQLCFKYLLCCQNRWELEPFLQPRNLPTNHRAGRQKCSFFCKILHLDARFFSRCWYQHELRLNTTNRHQEGTKIYVDSNGKNIKVTTCQHDQVVPYKNLTCVSDLLHISNKRCSDLHNWCPLPSSLCWTEHNTEIDRI